MLEIIDRAYDYHDAPQNYFDRQWRSVILSWNRNTDSMNLNKNWALGNDTENVFRTFQVIEDNVVSTLYKQCVQTKHSMITINHHPPPSTNIESNHTNFFKYSFFRPFQFDEMDFYALLFILFDVFRIKQQNVYHRLRSGVRF